MIKITRILSSIHVLSAILTSVGCDIRQDVKEEIEKNLRKGIENFNIPQDNQLHEVAVRYLNYPVIYWNQNAIRLKESKACTKFPPPNEIQFQNTYWQTYETSDGTFRLYNSYLDDRKLVGRKTVRILAMVNRKTLHLNLNCLLWFNNSSVPVVTRVFEYRLIWHTYWLSKDDATTNLPYLISCLAPETHEDDVPIAVTLAERPCEQTWNVLKLIYDKPLEKKQFAVCVKGLDFPFWDISVQLVEWIELCRLLGVNKIFLYNFQVHPNVEELLDYYTKTGYVEVTPLSYSLGKPHNLRVAYGFRDEAKKHEQVIAYNDCWNKNLYKYEHISMLDIDELIIPLMVNTWSELITDIETRNQQNGGKKFASYVAQEARFSPAMGIFSKIPSYMTMTRRVLRLPITQKGYQSKSILDTEMVLTVHNHYPVDILQRAPILEMNTSLAQLNHYRYCNLSNYDCPNIDINNGTIDVTLWKYFKRLKNAVQEVVKNVESLNKFTRATNGWLG